MTAFDDEREDIGQVVVDFVALANGVVDLRGGRRRWAEQLRRASLSVPLHIAEGSKDFRARDRMLLRSVTGCSAILDVSGHPRLVLRRPGTVPGTETGTGAERGASTDS